PPPPPPPPPPVLHAQAGIPDHVGSLVGSEMCIRDRKNILISSVSENRTDYRVITKLLLSYANVSRGT
ncbi:hypothetical protein ACN6Q1_13700, partial [Acinetobacter baumannii]